MKKKLAVFVALISILVLTLQVTSLAAKPGTASILNNNVAYTQTNFGISSYGTAEVDVRYDGYKNITTGAEISVVIKKNTFLWFTSTVVDETYNIVGENYSHTYYYDLTSSGSGTYKCYVTYTISGSGGADDVIPYEGQASY